MRRREFLSGAAALLGLTRQAEAFGFGKLGAGYSTGGFLGSARGYTFVNAEAAAIVAAMVVQPPNARKALIDTQVGAMKSAGVWALLKAYYAFAAHTSQAALINWISPGTFNATLVNSPTFAADRGFTGDGATSYISTGITPSVVGGLLARDSMHVSGRALTNLTGAANPLIAMSASSAVARVLLRPQGAAGSAQAIINGSTGAIEVTVAAGATAAHWIYNRSGASATQLYKNGSSVGTSVAASAGLTDQTISFLYDAQVPNYALHQIASGSIGGSLDATKAAALASAELAYMQAIGAA